MRILALEPYYGGSHRAFLNGWQDHSRHDFTTIGLPPRTWKWRMRHAAVTLAEQVRELAQQGHRWDAIFCSDMLNLAEFLGLCPASVARLPSVAYFHENQLTYPVQEEDERDFHFGYTNFTTCLAADAVWFNSVFHRDDFLTALAVTLGRMPDYRSLASVESIRDKSQVQPPGVEDFPTRESRKAGPLRLLWAARWEHDKNPHDFFSALEQMTADGVDFRASVIGEQFRETPPIFAEHKTKLAGRIDHWGFQSTRDAYRAALMAADVFVSTANHEFFGIAAVEAIAAGCYPLLPNRLAYPELLQHLADPSPYLYDGSVSQLAEKLARLSRAVHNQQLWMMEEYAAGDAIGHLRWQVRAAELDAAIVRACSS